MITNQCLYAGEGAWVAKSVEDRSGDGGIGMGEGKNGTIVLGAL